MTDSSVQLDFRVGGRFEIVMHGERDYHHRGEFLAIERDRLLVFTWISAWMVDGEQETSARVELEPTDDGQTRLVLTHLSLRESGVYDGHEDGWSRILLPLCEAVVNPEGNSR